MRRKTDGLYVIFIQMYVVIYVCKALLDQLHISYMRLHSFEI